MIWLRSFSSPDEGGAMVRRRQQGCILHWICPGWSDTLLKHFSFVTAWGGDKQTNYVLCRFKKANKLWKRMDGKKVVPLVFVWTQTNQPTLKTNKKQILNFSEKKFNQNLAPSLIRPISTQSSSSYGATHSTWSEFSLILVWPCQFGRFMNQRLE